MIRSKAVVLCGFLAGCGGARPAPPAPPPVVENHPPPAPRPAPCTAKCLPAVDLVDTDGVHHGPGELAGHVVIIDFWATWAHPCQRELPVLAHLEADYHDRGVIVIGIVTNDQVSDQDLVLFRRDLGVTFPIVRGTSEILTAFGYPQALPTSFVYDRSGTEVAQRVGPYDEAKLRAVLDPLVSAGSEPAR